MSRPMRILAAMLATGCGLALVSPSSTFSSAGQVGGKVVVELRSSSQAPTSVVCIGAIADIHGGNPALCQQIAGLDVAELADVGRSCTITREQVFYRIRLAGIEASQFQLAGQSVCMAYSMPSAWSEKEIVACAEKAIAKQLGVELKDVQFELSAQVQLPELTSAPPVGMRLMAEILTRGTPVGRVRAEVALVVENAKVCVVPVVLNVSCYKQIALAVRHLDRDEMLDDENVRGERRLVKGGEQFVAYSDKLKGQRVLRAVAINQPLTSSDIDLGSVEDPVLVHSRDTVKLIAVVGTMTLTATGEALQDGRDGQIIQVRNLDSGRVIRGRVVGYETVEVEH